MITIQQLIRKGRKPKRTGVGSKAPAREGRPQVRGVCLKVYHINPKKPCSGNRQVTSIRRSNGNTVIAAIPGEGAHGLQEHSTVLVRGGRVPNLPGVRYKVIRGVLDSKGVPNRKTSRSKYGTSKKEGN